MSSPTEPASDDASHIDVNPVKIAGHLENALAGAGTLTPSTAPSSPRANGGDPGVQRVKNLPGYTTPVFKGKDEQRIKVQNDLRAKVRCPHPSLPQMLEPPPS
jgi:glutamate dehydrogenase